MLVKNVTIALDDDTHRRARIAAAERGLSLSALVKQCLETLVSGAADAGATHRVEDKVMPFEHAPVGYPAGPAVPKPRQPGALRGKINMADDFDQWPQWLLDAFEGKDSDRPWPE